MCERAVREDQRSSEHVTIVLPVQCQSESLETRRLGSTTSSLRCTLGHNPVRDTVSDVERK